MTLDVLLTPIPEPAAAFLCCCALPLLRRRRSEISSPNCVAAPWCSEAKKALTRAGAAVAITGWVRLTGATGKTTC